MGQLLALQAKLLLIQRSLIRIAEPNPNPNRDPFVNQADLESGDVALAARWMIPTEDGTDMEAFSIAGINYLAVASRSSGGVVVTGSKVYKYDQQLNGNYGNFAEFQTLETKGANDFEFFTCDSFNFLVVANSEDATGSTRVNSIVYRFETLITTGADRFVQHQTFPTIGASDWEPFIIGTQQYLAVANSDDGLYSANSGSQNSVVYKWDLGTAQFYAHQNIQTKYCSDLKFVSAGGYHFLAVANRYYLGYSIDSEIYRWDTTSSQFVALQTVATDSASDWEAFTGLGGVFLTVANFYNGNSYSQNSLVLQYDDGTERFVQRAVIQTTGVKQITAVTPETNSTEVFLALANYQEDSIDHNRAINSRIVKFNTVTYQVETLQEVSTYGAMGFYSFEIIGSHYLAVINSWANDSSAVNSYVFNWITPSTISAYSSSNDSSLVYDIPLAIQVVRAKPTLTFLSFSNSFTKGQTEIDVAVINECGSSSIAVSPPLPSGLSVMMKNRGISVTGSALVVSDAISYTVTSTNPFGSTSIAISMAINDVAPTGLIYQQVQGQYTAGVAISANAPSSNGGPIVTYSISPSLPAGLSFSTQTGVIQGTPTDETSSSLVFTIFGVNSGGSTNTQIVITVSRAPLGTMVVTYPNVVSVYTSGTVIAANVPNCEECGYPGQEIVYSLSPNVTPQGLSFSVATGTISGTPTSESTAEGYLITVTNTVLQRTATTTIQIEVVKGAEDSESTATSGETESNSVSNLWLGIIVTTSVLGVSFVVVMSVWWYLRSSTNLPSEEISHEGEIHIHLERNELTTVKEALRNELAMVKEAPEEHADSEIIKTDEIIREETPQTEFIEPNETFDEWTSDQVAAYIEHLGQQGLGKGAFRDYAYEIHADDITGGMICEYDTLEDLLDDLNVDIEAHRELILRHLGGLIESCVNSTAVQADEYLRANLEATHSRHA